MPFEITCPACRHRLRIADEAQGLPLTCPRCLARLPAQRPAATPTGRGGLPRPGADSEIRSDIRVTGLGLILLAVIVAVLWIMYYCFLISGLLPARGEDQNLLFGLIVSFLALLSTGFLMWFSPESPAAWGISRVIRGIGWVILGTVALAGVLFLTMVIYIFAVCVSGGKPL